MKASSIATASFCSALLLLLPSTASSSYLNQANGEGDRSVPYITLVTEDEQQRGGELRRMRQEFTVPLTETHEYTVGLRAQETDQLLREYLAGDYQGWGMVEAEPRILVSRSGRLELPGPRPMPEVVDSISSDDATHHYCWLDLENGERVKYVDAPTTELVRSISCLSMYFDPNFDAKYQSWLFSQELDEDVGQYD